jgi:hypothetical protein
METEKERESMNTLTFEARSALDVYASLTSYFKEYLNMEERYKRVQSKIPRNVEEWDDIHNAVVKLCNKLTYTALYRLEGYRIVEDRVRDREHKDEPELKVNENGKIEL